MNVTPEMRDAIFKFYEIDCNGNKDAFARITGASRTCVFTMFKKGRALKTLKVKSWNKYKPLVQKYIDEALEENERKKNTGVFSKSILDALNSMEKEDQKLCIDFILFHDERKRKQGMISAVGFCEAMDDLQIPILTLDREGSYLKANINWLNLFNKSERHIIDISIGKKLDAIKSYFEDALEGELFNIDDHNSDYFIFLSIKKDGSLIQTLSSVKPLKTF